MKGVIVGCAGLLYLVLTESAPAAQISIFPTSEGGWNALLTAWAQVDILNPIMMPYLAANCDKARPGWPCDAEMEKLRDDYARATTPQDRARLAAAAQVLNTKIVTQIPIGEFWNVTAVGKNVLFEASSMVTVYWGIDKR